MPLDFTWSAPLVGTPQQRSVPQTPLFSEVIQPGLRMSVTFSNRWEPLENEANQINRITIPEVQYIIFLGICWSNLTIRHTLVFTAGFHETCLDLLDYGEPHSNPQCNSTVGPRICLVFLVVTLLSLHRQIELFLTESSQSSGQTISMAETAGGSYACHDERENMENLTD